MSSHSSRPPHRSSGVSDPEGRFLTPAQRRRLLELLAERSYREGDFVLSSGARSPFYLDAKQVTYHPEGLPLVARGVLDAVASLEVRAVGGLTMGADPVVAGVVAVSAQAGGAPLSGFVVRKEPKGHGTGRWIEGILEAGWPVAVVDDVVTTGGSTLEAVERARELGGEVRAAVALVDRGEGGREAVEELGIPYRPIVHLDEVRRLHSGRG